MEFGQTVGGFEAKEINGGLRWGARETEGVGWQRSLKRGGGTLKGASFQPSTFCGCPLARADRCQGTFSTRSTIPDFAHTQRERERGGKRETEGVYVSLSLSFLPFLSLSSRLHRRNAPTKKRTDALHHHMAATETSCLKLKYARLPLLVVLVACTFI